MPRKIDRSADMDINTFNTLFMQYHPLVCRVALSFMRSRKLVDSPLFSSKDDVINFAYLEMRRLGTFSQFDGSRANAEDGKDPMVTYVGEQVLAILRHAWQDHCRLNCRFRVSESVHTEDEEGSRQTHAMDAKGSWDPDFSWDLSEVATSDAAEEANLLDLLETEAHLEEKHDVSMVVSAMRRLPELAAAPSASAIAAALSFEPGRAAKALKSLRTLALNLGL